MYYRRNVVFRHTTLIFINMMEESLTKKDYTKIVLTYIFYGFVVGIVAYFLIIIISQKTSGV